MHKLELLRALATIFLAALLLPLMSHAQSGQYFLPTYLQKTPNSASLGKYGDYQVNMFSGVPDISIPLYEAESGSLKVPITLSYHASGIKVIDVASWVGLGWSVSAGGDVSRKVMGLPDESGNGYLQGQLQQAMQPGYLTDNNDNGRTFMTLTMMGSHDGQPDIFSYDFSGHSGKFFFDGLNSYIPRMVPYAPIKVTRNHSSGYNGINSFTITDEHGIQYFFGQTVQNSGSFSSQGSFSNEVSSWPLEKILSQDLKDTVTFSYSSASYAMPVDASETVTVDDKINPLSTTCPAPYSASTGTGSVTNNGSTVTEQQLNTIYFKNGKVVFELASNSRQDIPASALPAPKSLQDIKIYGINVRSGQYQLLKTIWFYQSYFQKGTDATTQRLRLDSVAVMDAAGATVQRYTFAYNSLSLPVYTSKGKDYWGYYNGKDNQTTLVPDTTIDFYPNINSNVQYIHIGSTITHARYPDTAYTQASMLTSITYPTGGHTDFAYESNRYKDKTGVIQLAGGLRVKSIKSYDGINAAPVVKTYEYSNANTYPNFHLGNYSFVTEQTYRYYPTYSQNGCGFQHTGEKRTRTFVSSPTSDIEAWDSTPVAYEVVTEYEGDGTTNNGKTIYQFQDTHDVPTGSSQVLGRPFYDSYFFQRGQLLQKSVYKNIGGGYQIVSREQNSYVVFPKRIYDTIGFVVSKRVVNDGIYATSGNISYGSVVGSDDNGRYVPSMYGIVSWDSYLKGKTTTTYDQNDSTKSVSSTTTYKYDNFAHQQVSRAYHTDSKGNTTVTTNRYAPDYLSGGTTGLAVMDTMIAHNMVAEPIEKWDTLKIVSPASAKIISAQLNRYKAGSTSSITVPSTISILNSTTPITGFVPATVSGGALNGDSRYTQMISFDQYDTKNELVQYTPRNTTPVSVIWDYNNSLPIAEIKNAPAGHFAYTSFETGNQGNWSYYGATVLMSGTPTGSRAYNLSAGSISSPSLPTDDTYMLTYWSNGGAATVTGSAAIAGTALKTVNGWTLYQHDIPASTTAITVSGSVTIDELRLYPVDALMSTYTYDPLIGITSTCDAKSQISYYEYDSFQRLHNIRDLYGNIVKNFCYNYAGQQTGCPVIKVYYNAAKSVPFKRNNCGSGNVGTTVNYVVPANKYISTISQADADQQAQNEVNANGQNYANTNGQCFPDCSNCTAASQKCISNHCETGQMIYTSSVQQGTHLYLCTYHYQWSDGSVSQDYTGNSPNPCPLGGGTAAAASTTGTGG